MAQVEQGERMGKYAQQRSQGTKRGNKIAMGTVLMVRVDKVDRGKLDHKSVPGVIVEVTEYNYRITCKGGVLKDCLGRQRFQVEKIKRVELYDLHEAFGNWKFIRKISIWEAPTFISTFSAIVRVTVIKTHVNARKRIGCATANAPQGTLGALITIDVVNICN